MYNAHEAAVLKQQFWTSFGQYMAPVPSAEGVKINWINYKTGIKDLRFSMQADAASATISIQLMQADTHRQTAFFEQFRQLKNLLQTALQEEWQWALHRQDENHKIISEIYCSLTGVHILRKEDWPAIISFFKPRIIALDAFWTEVKYGFEV